MGKIEIERPVLYRVAAIAHPPGYRMNAMDVKEGEESVGIKEDATYMDVESKASMDVKGSMASMDILFPPSFPTAAPFYHHTPCLSLPRTIRPRLYRGSWALGLMEELAEIEEEWGEVKREVWDLQQRGLLLGSILLLPDPPQPRVSLRIPLGPAVSLHVHLSAQSPRSLPSYMRLLGPAGRVAPWREGIESSRTTWEEKHSVFQNIQNLFTLTRMAHGIGAGGDQEEVQDEEEMGTSECGICYAYTWSPPEETVDTRGTFQGPDQFCTHCERPFHHPCLSEWLMSTADTRISLGVMFGKCPYCAEQLECPVDRVAMKH
ncbi:FANCL C-terminal domain-containing protein [Piptocephalis cylindrospora]|uniref:FANCL C-terminal domain-containing protein n=1 Tax=Piptocephalis cylindrospora TaxID=1907219 RepID=A0A4V1IXN1_9FUNG|nr:FANCL C-terminal domain-containing protein [Piptocephalis cylindrospora]|eukprot:RKP11639.1 FANCL C-terminal domain-containing protein [Piptocephalis cylindrospora]